MRRLTNNAFPDCCGIYVLTGFSYRSSDFASLGPGKVDPTIAKDYESDVDEFFNKCKTIGLGLVALNSIQVSAGIGDLLIAKGMKKIVDPFYHPGHQRYITLYGYVSYPEKQQTEVKPELSPEPKPEPKVEVKPKTGLFSKPSGIAKKRLVRRKLVQKARWPAIDSYNW